MDEMTRWLNLHNQRLAEIEQLTQQTANAALATEFRQTAQQRLNYLTGELDEEEQQANAAYDGVKEMFADD